MDGNPYGAGRGRGRGGYPGVPNVPPTEDPNQRRYGGYPMQGQPPIAPVQGYPPQASNPAAPNMYAAQVQAQQHQQAAIYGGAPYSAQTSVPAGYPAAGQGYQPQPHAQHPQAAAPQGQQQQAWTQQQIAYYGADARNAYAAANMYAYPQQGQQGYQRQRYGEYQNNGYPQRGGGFGRGRGGRGGYHQEGYGGHPGGQWNAHPGRGFNPRGGRGMGRGNRSMRREEVLCIAHVDSFAAVHTASRTGRLASLLPPQILHRFSQQSPMGGYNGMSSVLRFLIVVGKRYLVAAVSEPKEAQDVVVSENTAKRFMDVENVLCDEGNLLVDLENGSKLAKHLYGQLRLSLVQMVAFDKVETMTEGKPEDGSVEGQDIFTLEPEALLKGMVSKKSVFEKLEASIAEDTPASLALFEKLLKYSSPNVAVDASGAAASAGDAADEEGMPFSGTLAVARRSHALLRSAQGTRLLTLALENPSKRAAFFQRIKEEGEEIVALRGSAFTAPEATLLLTFISSVLTSPLLFHCFGIETRLNGAVAPPPAWEDREQIMDIICTRIGAEGILLLRSNGGSCMMTALARRLRPSFPLYDGHQKVSDRRVATLGYKRGRGDDGNETSATAADPKADLVVPFAPSTLQDVGETPAPLDWRFFHACANAFVAGRIPDRQSQPNSSGERSSSGSGPIVTLTQDEITPAMRLPLLTDHIISCRAVQIFFPHFIDAVLSFEKQRAFQGEAGATPSPYVQQCMTLLETLAARAKELMLHPFGNYVAQSILLELVPRAVPHSCADTTLRSLLDSAEKNVMELGSQKCASNVVERAIGISASLKDGDAFIIRIAEVMLKSEPKTLLDMATNQYGNYVLLNVLKKLQSSSEKNVPEKEAATKALTDISQLLSNNLSVLQGSRFSSGLVNFIMQSK